MIEHALDSNNDILIRNGSFATVKEGAQVAQHTRTRLLFYLEEWFADKRAGVPYFQEIFVKPFNPGLTESILKSRIANTPELESLVEFAINDIDPVTRILKISFSANTAYGEINSEEIYVNV